MKKAVIILGLLVLSLSTVDTSAQTPTFTKGDNVLGLGFGVGGSTHTGYALAGLVTGTKVKVSPYLFVNFEHCIIDNLFDEKSSIGVGGQFGYRSVSLGWNENLGWKTTIFTINAKGAFHYALVDNLDTYAGVTMGYNIEKTEYAGGYNTEPDRRPFGYNLFVGARYYFTSNIAVFGELGFGTTVLNLGLAFKF